jgi:hypothetical protein
MREPRGGGGHPITILVTDVQGSTQLRARHGDRLADEILHDHEAIVRRAVEAHGGDEAAFLGTGFCSPSPHRRTGWAARSPSSRASSGTGGTTPTAASGSASGCTRVRPPGATAPSTGRPSTPPPGSWRRRPAARSWSPRPCMTRSGRRRASRSSTVGSTGCAASPTAGGCTRPSGDGTTPAGSSGRARPRSWGGSGSGPTCAGRSRMPGSGTARWCWSRARPGSARAGWRRRSTPRRTPAGCGSWSGTAPATRAARRTCRSPR